MRENISLYKKRKKKHLFANGILTILHDINHLTNK